MGAVMIYALGDDGCVHAWKPTAGEACKRVCDGTAATNIEVVTEQDRKARRWCHKCTEAPRE